MVQWWCVTGRSLRAVVLNPRSSLSSSPTAAYHTIQAIPREYTGNRVSARDRAQGRIPAVVFPLNENTYGADVRSVARKHLLTTEKKQIRAILDSIEPPFFFSTTFPLQIRAGSGSSVLLESGTVLPIKIHRDPETGNILNLVFVWADKDSELKVDVPLVFKGEDVCPGLQKGGHLYKIRPSIKYVCPAEHIPPKIEVDISKLDIGDKIYTRDIDVHPSLKLVRKSEDMPVCKILATKAKEPEPNRV